MSDIKPSHRGMLHDALNIAKNRKIPGSKLKAAVSRAKRTGNTKLEREAIYAENVRK
jgi:hypothetical protein